MALGADTQLGPPKPLDGLSINANFRPLNVNYESLPWAITVPRKHFVCVVLNPDIDLEA